MARETTIKGDVHPEFGGVADAFSQNFEFRNELGASVCVIRDGETVVDLWGGYKDEARTTEWQEDTVSIVFSCTKAATALCAHRLVDRGQLNLNAKVADYWPEYACNGKEDTTVLMMLNHSAGVPAFHESVEPDGCLDWDATIKRMSAMEPWWEPGTLHGYHALTFGWTVGELVRRISGRSLGEFLRDELAGPLGADFSIGLPESEEGRVAPMVFYKPSPGEPIAPFTQKMIGEPDSIQAKAFVNTGGIDYNVRKTHAAELGAAGGIANARSMARLFSSLSSSVTDSYFSQARIEAMGYVSTATRFDATLMIPTRFGQGFMCSMDNRHIPGGHDSSFIIGKNAFGHVGMGGSCVFFDPDRDLIFAYSMNQMGPGILLNSRGQSLIDATYDALGYSGNAPGFWMP